MIVLKKIKDTSGTVHYVNLQHINEVRKEKYYGMGNSLCRYTVVMTNNVFYLDIQKKNAMETLTKILGVHFPIEDEKG